MELVLEIIGLHKFLLSHLNGISKSNRKLTWNDINITNIFNDKHQNDKQTENFLHRFQTYLAE